MPQQRPLNLFHAARDMIEIYPDRKSPQSMVACAAAYLALPAPYRFALAQIKVGNRVGKLLPGGDADRTIKELLQTELIQTVTPGKYALTSIGAAVISTANLDTARHWQWFLEDCE